MKRSPRCSRIGQCWSLGPAAASARRFAARCCGSARGDSCLSNGPRTACSSSSRNYGDRKPIPNCSPCIADITDTARIDQIFGTHQPAVVFHAAAHKHVPMMESNPGEAIKNNVLGTKRLAELADHHGVQEFVMISTDKAVNPTSVMGASKQVAERFVHAFSEVATTKFVVVRFGNVLASAGSVVPIFQEQIRRGGPITVTHPEIERFFMTIPEASQLVLQAAAMGKGGEIFVLDMGESVRIVDLAQDLIRLSGLDPDDIEIVFTGLRPGEKLYEEIVFQRRGNAADAASETVRCLSSALSTGRSEPLDRRAGGSDSRADRNDLPANAGIVAGICAAGA